MPELIIGIIGIILIFLFRDNLQLIVGVMLFCVLLRIFSKVLKKLGLIMRQKKEERALHEYEMFLIENFDTVNINTLSGQEFESFTARLLQLIGFTNVRTTKASGDHGIDVIAEANGLTIGIQCKRYAKSVGNSAVQEAFSGAGFYGCDRALVITNSYFTPQAIEEAERLGVKLWDGKAVSRLIRRIMENDEDSYSLISRMEFDTEYQDPSADPSA
ncbi:MAG: restriction endonuclease [Lachnospiraceae bacterium]|nr:restriction endonuclease [Lachnospiraceae bacterium]